MSPSLKDGQVQRKVEDFARTNVPKRNLRWGRTEAEGSDGGPGAEGHVTSNLVESEGRGEGCWSRWGVQLKQGH